jgi:UDP-glucose 4-epimerase
LAEIEFDRRFNSCNIPSLADFQNSYFKITEIPKASRTFFELPLSVNQSTLNDNWISPFVNKSFDFFKKKMRILKTMFKKILVTGGSGVIGTHVVRLLSHLGYDVFNIDRERSPYLNSSNQIVEDIIDVNPRHQLFKNARCVIHLAGLASIDECQRNPKSSFKDNSFATIKMLEICKMNVINKIIFSSSAAVYKEKEGATKETDFIQPHNIYGIDKAYCEQYIQTYAESFNINFTICRLFNVINDKKGVVASFLNAKNTDQPATIFGDGTQTRDFIRVEDVAAIIEKLLPIDENMILNVGTGIATSINEVAQQIGCKTFHVDKKEKEIKHSCADISNLKKVLNL